MIDQIDKKILELLQADSTLLPSEIAHQLDLDEKQCEEKISKLEKGGVIKKSVTLLDPRQVGANMTVFVAITTPEHSEEWLEKFHKAVVSFPEVVEFYRMSGQVDYLLRIVVPDIEAYDAVYKRLISAAKLKDISSSFAMEQIKFTTELPIRI